MRGYNKNTIEKDAKKYEAYKIYNRAVASGQIIPNKKCENCLEIGKIDGHHPDYDNPLCVVWLCDKCHGRLQGCSQFKDCSSLSSFGKRTSKTLTQQEKEDLYKKIGLNKYRQMPIEELCSLEELAQLEEFKELNNRYMTQCFEARALAQIYYEKRENLLSQLREKYPQDVERLY